MNQNTVGISIWLAGIAALFTTCLIIANLIAVKLVGLAGLIFPAGVIIFPVSYILGDVLTEVYGYRRARQVIWLGFFCNLIMVAAVVIGDALPPADIWEGQEAYEAIFGQSPRILVASFLAYLVGEFSNAAILARLKVLAAGKRLWMRTIGSTIVGQGLDSIIFITVAFVGIIPASGLINAILTQWGLKTGYETLATPLTYMIVTFLKQKEGLDAYDYETSFNPFSA